MIRFENIQCPVDFSEFSDLALRYAASLAEEFESRLVILHTLPDPVLLAGFSNTIPPVVYDLTTANERLNDMIAQTVSRRIPMTTKNEFGVPARVILKTVEEEDCDLIVMGTHGSSGFEALLIGSTTNKVLHKCEIPVMVVCKPQRDFLTGNANHPVQFKKILCAVAPDTVPVRMAQMALSIAKKFQSSILFYEVGEKETPRVESLAQIKEMITPEDYDWCRIEYRTENGNPGQLLLQTADKWQADLLVVGHHIRRPMALEVLGSVALKVVRASSCPVLVVRE